MPPKKSEENERVCASSSRKPYVTPDIVEYGSLADITLTVGNNSRTDNGSVTNFTKTK